jgi:LPS export ABC transporter protein LptC
MNILKLYVLTAALLISCSEQKIKPLVTTSLTSGRTASQESWNSDITFTENGKLNAVLFSDHLMMYEEERETLLEGMKIDFYNEEGIKSSKLTSKRGRVDNATNNMFAIDSVVAVNDSGVTLKTDELMWRNSDQKIVTDRFVTIFSPDEEIRGYGFESDQNLKNYKIFNITYTGNKPKSE